MTSRKEARRIGLQLFEEHAVGGDLALRLTVGRARHGHRHRAAGAVAGQADDAHVVAEVLAAELRADAGLLGEPQHLGLQLDVAEGVTRHRALGRQRVEVVRRRQLGGLDGQLRRRAADHDGEVIRRAGGGAQRLHLLEDERQQRRLVEQRLGLLVEVRLVGAATALGDEEERVRVAVDRGDLDLGRQVGAGVALLVHRQRGHLAVAQVGGHVGALHTLGDRRLVAAAGEHELTLLRLDDRRARVLAHRQHAARRDGGVLQQVEGDEAVVVARLRVVEDLAQLGQVIGPEEVGDVAHRRRGERGDRLGLDLQEPTGRRVERGDAVRRDQAVRRGVRRQREHLRVLELTHRHHHVSADGSSGHRCLG